MGLGHVAGCSRAWDGFQKVLRGNQQETARVLLRCRGGLERGREGTRAAGDRCVGQWAGGRACRGHHQGRGPVQPPVGPHASGRRAVPGPSIREDREQVCEGEAPCRALPPGGGPGRVVLPWDHGLRCTHSVRYLRAGCPLDDCAGSLGLQGGELKILVVSGTWCWRLWPRLGSGTRLLGLALRPGCPPGLPLVSCRPFS